MTNAAKVAWSFLIVCLLAWLSTFAFLDNARWVTLVRHGLEGAFVGGLCDAFAIWRMYVAVEKGYEPLSQEVSKFVVQEVMKADNLSADIRETLDSPATAEGLLKLINEKIPTKRRLEAVCLDFWDSDLRELALNRMVNADLQPLLDDSGNVSSLLDDLTVRQVLRHCLSAAIDNEERTSRLRDVLPIPGFFKAVGLSKGSLQNKLSELVEELGEPPTPGASEAGALLREYATSFFSAWAMLTEEKRRETATIVLEAFGEPVIRRLADVIWDERNDIVEFLGRDDVGLSRHPFVEFVMRELEPVIGRSPKLLEAALEKKLTSMGGAGVRQVIEANTRARLDMIQVNGTLLGACVGLAVGAMALVAPLIFP